MANATHATRNAATRTSPTRAAVLTEMRAQLQRCPEEFISELSREIGQLRFFRDVARSRRSETWGLAERAMDIVRRFDRRLARLTDSRAAKSSERRTPR